MPSLWGKLRVFSDKELYDLHCETLKVLENVGIGVHHDKVLERLEAAGLHVDFDTKVVKFPPEHIEETLRTCRIMDRRVPKPQKRLEFSADGGPLAVIDLDTNQIRPATLQDLADAVRTVGNRLLHGFAHFVRAS
jgi:trimethylamine---corrinoid protein Co-methyltransferase